MNKKAIAPILLSSVMIITSFSGCGSKTDKAAGTATSEPTGKTQVITDKQAEAITLPISKEKISLSYFAMPEPYVVTKMKGYADMVAFQEAEKRTNIAIKWREESYTDPKPKLNLMFSTGEPEDIIWDAYNANGGAKKLLDDGMILSLTDYVDKYAPNLKKLMKENPQLMQEISTDDGRIYMFPEIRLDPTTRANSGFQVRNDWLKNLNLKAPTTIDEWYTVLKDFKEKDPNGNGQKDEVPFVSLSRKKNSQSFTNFAPGFGILDVDFYVDKDKVKFGPLEAGYKDYVTTLAKWYKEGLIDPEYATMEAKNFDAKITGDKGGAYYAALSGNLGKYLSTKKDDPSFDLVGVQNPKAADGKSYAAVSAFGKMVPHGASIGKNNKHIIETIKWLDWHFSEEGITLFNWGIEGKSFTGKGQDKKFTDLIMKNPDKLSIEEADAKYAGCVLVQMPGIDDPLAFQQLKCATPQQLGASKAWGTMDTSRIIPPLFFDETRTQENANILSEANTYLDEMFNKFVMGIEPLENYDKFVQKLKEMKVEQVVKNYQESYDKAKKK